jgi:hypothetical protein
MEEKGRKWMGAVRTILSRQEEDSFRLPLAYPPDSWAIIVEDGYKLKADDAARLLLFIYNSKEAKCKEVIKKLGIDNLPKYIEKIFSHSAEWALNLIEASSREIKINIYDKLNVNTTIGLLNAMDEEKFIYYYDLLDDEKKNDIEAQIEAPIDATKLSAYNDKKRVKSEKARRKKKKSH